MSIHLFSFLVIISAHRSNIFTTRQGSQTTRTNSQHISLFVQTVRLSNENGAVQGFVRRLSAEKAQETPYSKSGF